LFDPTKLTPLLLLLLVAAPVQGQDEELEDEFAFLEESISSEEVESASKHRQPILWSPSAITVITRDDIRTSGANTLTDLLRRIPGLDVYEMKPSFPLIGARALTDDTNNLVLLLVDGREAMVELAGFVLWAALTFDLDEVERVEVIRGPGSTLYGANAFAAVVNVTTVSDRPVGGGDVLISGGNEGHQRLFGRVRGSRRLGGGTLSFSAGLGTEARRSPSDKRYQIKLVRLRSHGFLRYLEGRSLDLSLHGGVSYGDGLPYFVSGGFRAPNVLNHWSMGKAGLSLGEKTRFKAQFYHTRYASDFFYRAAFYAYGVWLADAPEFNFDMNSYDTQVQLDFQATDNLLFVGGGNLRYSTMESARLLPHEISEIRGAGFIHAQLNPWEALQFTGGVRLDLNSETDAALSPRVVVVVQPHAGHTLRLGYGLAFRKPSFLENRVHVTIENYNPAMPELEDKLAESFGNEDLTNEKVHSLEAGWRGRFLDKRLHISIDAFFNVYQNMIYFESELKERLGMPDITNSILHYERSAEDVKVIGGEVEVSWRQGGNLRLYGNAGLRKVVEKKEGERLVSEPLLRVNLVGCYETSWGMLVDIALHYVSSYETPLKNPSNPFETAVPISMGDNLLVVARLGWHLLAGADGSLEAGLTARIPVGEPFREYAGMPVPDTVKTDTASDFGGEILVSLVSFYLRGTF
jgi:outer membrane receptor protein involved in Fe transport